MEIIENKIYSEELEKDIEYKVIFFDILDNTVIEKLYINNILYFDFEKQNYFYTELLKNSILFPFPDNHTINGLDKRHIDYDRVIIKDIMNSFVYSTYIEVTESNIDMNSQMIEIRSKFYILDKEYRHIYRLNHYKYNEYSNKNLKINGLENVHDKYILLQPFLFNILKEIFSDIYYHTEKDYFTYFKETEKEKILLKKQLANF